MSQQEYIKEGEEYFIHAYNRFPVVIERGEGCYVYDTDGKKYLDFAAGIAVNSLGHGNEKWKDALKKQIDMITHTSNLYYNVPAVSAAKKVVKATGLSKVFFTNSGAEACEAALKIARKYRYQKTGNNDGEIIAMENSFHGRTMGALAMTGNEDYRTAFGPMVPGIKYAKFNDLESVKSLISDKTCGIIFEVVQGEGGIYPCTKEFYEGIRKLCDSFDALMICDEIQCGMGRCGRMFAYQEFDGKPDVVTCAKALGCGIPVGAVVTGKKCCDILVPGDHGSTYGGNPLAAAAVNAVFDIFSEEKILDHVNETASYLEEKLDDLALSKESIIERRGKGLMQGIALKCPVADVISKAQDKGLLVISAGGNVLRLVPPLIIGKNEVDMLTEILDDILE